MEFMCCEICGLFGLANDEMQSHIRDKHPKDQREYGCDLCDSVFFRLCDRTAHYKSNHKGNHPFNCAKCKNGFIRMIEAEVHNKTCSKIKKTHPVKPNMNVIDEKIKEGYVRVRRVKIYDYKCDECEETFDELEEVLEHKAKSHPKFVCRWCQSAFSDESSLKTHFIENHDDILLRACLTK